MKKIFIIKTGSTFPETAAEHGDFEEMTKHGLNLEKIEISTINASVGEALPNPEDCCGVIITGAHCMVTDNLLWSLAIEAWIPSLIKSGVPLLGICYGHQLLGRAMGGLVDFHPQGKEVGTVDLELTEAGSRDLLFNKLPQQFPAHATHAQSVLTLPPGAILLAKNMFEPHHAFRIGPCAWGVQFHPEYNAKVMREYVVKQTESLTQSGQEVNSLLNDVRETPEANSLLKTFARFATTGETF